MKFVLGIFALFLLTASVLGALGIGLGWLLHWMIPAIEIGTGILIGVVVAGFSSSLLAYLIGKIPVIVEEDVEVDFLPTIERPSRARTKRPKKSK